MIRALQDFFTRTLSPEASVIDDSQLQLAAAALLIELVYADENVDPVEKKKLGNILQHTWNISKEEIDELIRLAEKEVDNAHDLYQFTRLINDHYTYPQKCQLVQSLWEIAFADNTLDKYEEALIRKLSDLLYVDHADFIRARQLASKPGLDS